MRSRSLIFRYVSDDGLEVRRTVRVFTRMLTAMLMLACGTQVHAQLPHTRLYAISPMGAQAGQTVDVTVTNGADLDELDSLHFSDSGIRAIHKSGNKFQVAVDDNVQPGIYEVRTRGLFGVSNPRAFVVGHEPEANEAEPNANIGQATKIQVGSTINAIINGGADVDFYSFDGKKDQSLVIELAAKRIDSQLRGVVEVMTASGRRIAKARGIDNKDPIAFATLPAEGTYFIRIQDAAFQGSVTFGYRLKVHSSPHIDFIMPPAGVAGTRSKFTLYGTNLGGTPSTQSINGRILEKLDVEITLPSDSTSLIAETLDSSQAGIDGFEWRFKNSNPVFIQFSDSPVSNEVEPNNAGNETQPITVPGEIAGQLQQTGDEDWFQFEINEARKQSLFIEVFGHRSGTTADPLLQVHHVTKNAKGEESSKRLTSQDDGRNPGGRNFLLSSRDPIFELKNAKPGLYRVMIRDRYFESRGDASLVYRLSIREPKPDFRLIAYPAVPANGNNPAATTGLVLRKGDNVPVEVLAIRKDGFNGQIELKANNLPYGVTAGPALIAAGKASTQIIVTADGDAPMGFSKIQIVGRAGDKIREARSGTIAFTGDANRANTARLSNGIGLSVMKDEQRLQPIAKATQLTVNQGRQVLIPVDLLKRAGFDNKTTFNFVGQPGNVDVDKNKTIEKGKTNNLFRMFVKNNAPLGSSQIYLSAAGQVSYGRNPWKVEREKAAQAKVIADIAAADAASKQAAANIATTTKRIIDLQTQLKATTATAAKAKQTADAAVVAMTVSKTKTDAANTTLAALTKVLQSNQASLKSTTEQSTGPEIEALKDALTKTAAAAKVAQEQAAAVHKKFATELAAATTIATAMQKAAADAAAKNSATEQSLKTTKDAKAKAEQAVKDAAAAKKKAEADKKAADKRVTDATNAAKPKNINVTVPSTPFILTIKKAPITVTAAVPNSGNIKRGAKIDVKVTIKRQHGFAGSVKVHLPLPTGVADLTAAPLEIAADKTEGLLSITAGPKATEGQLANMVVQAQMEFEGQAAVDAPIAIKVAK